MCKNAITITKNTATNKIKAGIFFLSRRHIRKSLNICQRPTGWAMCYRVRNCEYEQYGQWLRVHKIPTKTIDFSLNDADMLSLIFNPQCANKFFPQQVSSLFLQKPVQVTIHSRLFPCSCVLCWIIELQLIEILKNKVSRVLIYFLN